MDAASNSAVPNSAVPNSADPNSVTANISPPNSVGANEVAADEDAWSESSDYADDEGRDQRVEGYRDQRYADRDYADADYADYPDRDAAAVDDVDADYAGHDYAGHEYAGHEYAGHEYAEGEYATGPARPFRPGRGGYDAEAAAAAAQARYVVRQRLVLGLVLLAVATGLLAGGLHVAGGWYLHAAVDLCLVGYLVYLRRQVRVEQAIRARRAARMAGSRYRADTDRGSPLLEDPLGDAGECGSEFAAEYAEHDAEYAHRPGLRHAAGPMVRRGRRSRGRRRPTVGEAVAAREAGRRRAEAEADAHAQRELETDPEPGDGYEDEYGEYGYDEAGDGSGEQGDDELEQQSALPRLRPSAPPERPRGTVVLELDDEDPELHDLDSRPERGYRRAAGQ